MILLSNLPKVTLQVNIRILLIIKILLSQGVEAINQVNKRNSLNHKILLSTTWSNTLDFIVRTKTLVPIFGTSSQRGGFYYQHSPGQTISTTSDYSAEVILLLTII